MYYIYKIIYCDETPDNDCLYLLPLSDCIVEDDDCSLYCEGIVDISARLPTRGTPAGHHPWLEARHGGCVARLCWGWGHWRTCTRHQPQARHWHQNSHTAVLSHSRCWMYLLFRSRQDHTYKTILSYIGLKIFQLLGFKDISTVWPQNFISWSKKDYF